MSYGGREKKIVFYETDNHHAELKIKLHYDGFKQGEFFRSLVEAYLGDDENIAKFIEEYKIKNSKQGKRQRKIIKKEIETAKEIKNKFALDKTDIESIFDLLEEEII
jgi:hypothetical protein|tara:strand:- start:94 stop:414 length:321 start_codon:yes stop_codon:yes gene_type:complete